TQGDRVAVPGDQQTGGGLRHAIARAGPAGRGDRVPPRIRRGPPVGAGPAQPERVAPELPAPLRTWCHGDQCPVATVVLGRACRADTQRPDRRPPGRTGGEMTERERVNWAGRTLRVRVDGPAHGG